MTALRAAEEEQRSALALERHARAQDVARLEQAVAEAEGATRQALARDKEAGRRRSGCRPTRGEAWARIEAKAGEREAAAWRSSGR